MAGLRKGHVYNRITRPYTRHSRVKAKSYIKTYPGSKIVRFEMGNTKKQFQYQVELVARSAHQIRHNALESSRQIINRELYNELGSKGYYLKLVSYPYHVLRENKILGGAHADRIQSGMAHSFGKSIGLAAQVYPNSIIFIARVDQDGLNAAKEALLLAKPRMPGKYAVEVRKIEY